MSCKKLFFLFLFSVLSISIVFAQQNNLSFNESFNMVNPGNWNYSILSNRTKNDNSGILNADSLNTGFRWYVGNMRRASRNNGDGINYNTSLGFYHWNLPYNTDGIAGFGRGSENMDNSFIFTMMPEEFSLNEDTQISLMFNVSRMAVLFLDNSNKCVLGILNDGDIITDGTNDSVLNGHNYFPHSYCLGQNFDYSCSFKNTIDPPSTPIRVNFTLSYCGITNNINNLKKIVIMPIEPITDSNGFVDEFIISNYGNGSNYLPSINVSVPEDDFCYNGTQINVNFNISEYDPENDDVLYYSSFRNSYYNYNTTYHDFKKEGMFWLSVPDLTELSPLYTAVPNDACPVQYDSWLIVNESKHHLISGGIASYGLKLSNVCADANHNDYGWYYKIDSYYALKYHIRMEDFDSTDKLNISYLDRNLNELFDLQLQYVSGAIPVIQFWDRSNYLGNITANPWDYFDLSIVPGIDYYNITIDDLNYRASFNITANPFNETVAYVRMAVTGNSFLRNWDYSGSALDQTMILEGMVWDTEKPNSINLSDIGIYKFRITYTDEAHISDSYKITKEYQIKILPQDKCNLIDSDNRPLGSVDDHLENVDFLGALKSLFDSGMVKYLNDIGLYDTGKIILWWVYAMLFIILCFGQVMIARSISLSGAMLISSISIFFLALMIGYTTHVLVTLIFIAFGLAPGLVKIVSGE